MKVIALNGSPRQDGNTATALGLIGKILKDEGFDFEILHIGTQAINGCIGCGKCRETEFNLCIFNQDFVNDWILKLRNADGIILGSPVYYSGIAGSFKSALDRLFYGKSALYRYKVGAAICAVRRSGGSSTLDQLMHYLTISEMFIVNSTYWNIVHGREKAEMLLDGEGVQTLETLADNMSFLIKSLKHAEPEIPRPTPRKRVGTNFIR